jgi:glycosyltransferase involved in cell wall biosynthesis
MKVLHIIAGDTSGGAAKGALILHKELINFGIDSILLKQVGEEDPGNRIYCISNSIGKRVKRALLTFLDRVPLLFYKKRRRNVAFSLGYFGFDITKSKYYREADVINLHWVNQGIFSLRTIRKIKKPIVWTLRDMWLMTGGCHHSFECSKYQGYCAKCPVLGSSRDYDLSSYILRYKRRTISDKIYYVAISNWLKDVASKSSLLKGMNIRVIHNGIDASELKVINKKEARSNLGLPIERKIVLLGASNLHDPYKGWPYFLTCLPVLLEKTNVFIAFFGHLDVPDQLKSREDRFISFGRVDDSVLLNNIYSSADVFIAPSIAEAFGKTLVEAMLAGTPVVCFDSTAPAEIVKHKVTGYKAEDRNPSDLVAGILWCLGSEANTAELAANARTDALNRFTAEKMASEYQRLYEHILEKEAIKHYG